MFAIVTIVLVLPLVADSFVVFHNSQLESAFLSDTQLAATPVTKKRLSRPERKALERQRKAQRQQNNDGISRQVAPPIPDNATTTSLIRRLKKRIPSDDLTRIERLALHSTTTEVSNNATTVLWNQLTVAALHNQQYLLAERCWGHRQDHLKSAPSTATVTGQLPLLRALVVHNYTEKAWDMYETEIRTDVDEALTALCSMATLFFRHHKVDHALRACKLLRQLPQQKQQKRRNGAGHNLSDDDTQWTQLFQAAAQCQTVVRNGTLTLASTTEEVLPNNLVYAVLHARRGMNRAYKDPTLYEVVQNALARRVVFVTGAVQIQGCPAADRPEVCFIGRSNVGKSSLINLLTNRKSVAFTSKRPGKTQQFNYFAVNDKPGLEKTIRYGDFVPGEKDTDAMYIVDLPGFGYAQVPTHVRESWDTLWETYLTTRPTLRVIFHLMDGRHGPTADDAAMSERIRLAQQQQTEGSSSNKRGGFLYVVVLTKVDKNGKFHVSDAVRDAVDAAIPPQTPVIWTSAERRWGFDSLWRCIAGAVDNTNAGL